MKIYNNVVEALQSIADTDKINKLQSFFKTGKGEYAEGDVFIGVKVPENRIVAKEFYNQLTENDYKSLLLSPVHEHRLCGLIMLVYKYEKSKSKEQKEEFVRWYLESLEGVNNWDLVDSSCYKILGRHCYEVNDTKPIISLSESENMWHKRIAVVSTMHFVKKGSYQLTKDLVIKNLNHPHDLMHKANGWLIREMGEKNEQELIKFLDVYSHQMPRTSLRYAIEKLSPAQRKYYLEQKK